MSIFSKRTHGHYNEQGVWVREKFCFVSCGDKCDCMPPRANILAYPNVDKDKTDITIISEGFQKNE